MMRTAFTAFKLCFQWVQLEPLHWGAELMRLEHWAMPTIGFLALDYVSFVYPGSPHGVGLSDNKLAGRLDTPGGGATPSKTEGSSSRSGTPDGGAKSGGRKRLVGAATAKLFVTARVAPDDVFDTFSARLRKVERCRSTRGSPCLKPYI